MRKHTQYVLVLAMVTAGTIAYAPAVVAATSLTETFAVKITILSTCSLSTPATDVDFASPLSTATDVTATGHIYVTCTPGTSYTIEFDNGLHYSTTRRMNDGGGTGSNYVPYGLYQDSAHTLPWSTIAASEAYSGTGSGAEQNISVYGLVPSANYPATSYADTVTATVTY